MKLFSKKNRTYIHSSKGFTIIELMIAMTIFIVVATVGIGAIVNAMSQYHATKNIRTVTDNLNYVIEDIARNVRLASQVRCVTNPGEQWDDAYDGNGDIMGQNCFGSASIPKNKMIFRGVTGSDIMYTISEDGSTSGFQIYKQIGGFKNAPQDATSITPPNVEIDPLLSGFTVRNADVKEQQTVVTIRLAGKITYKNIISDFAIQTTVTPRQLKQ